MTVKTSEAYRTKAWALFRELGGKLLPAGSNAYQVWVPAGAWAAVPVAPAVPPLVRRYLGGRPGEGGTVWAVEGDSGRYRTAMHAAGVWAVRVGLVLMPQSGGYVPVQRGNEAVAETFTAAADAAYGAMASIQGGQLTAQQLQDIITAADKVRETARSALRVQHGI